MNTAAPTKKQKQDQLSANEGKWTKPLMDAGFTVLPSVILERQQALGLDAIDVNILLHLARHWWYADNLPHPSKITIAKCIGIDPSTVRRRIGQMEKDGLITRVSRHDPATGRQETNSYRFDGLITVATPFAEEAIHVKQQRQQDAVARRNRKRPRPFTVVRGRNADAE